MGGVATALTVGFGAPADLPVSWVLEMTRGFEVECAHVGAHIVGGDVTASDKIIIAVTAMGDVVRPVLRSGALPGDVVAYAGQLGLAGAGFAALSRGFRSPKAAVDAHRVPHPPYAAGPQAAGAGATAMTMVGPCDVGDVLGVVAGDFAVVGQDILAVAYEVIDRILSPAGEMLTVVMGEDAEGLIEESISEYLRTLRPDVDLVVYDGGQENYPLFIAVE